MPLLNKAFTGALRVDRHRLPQAAATGLVCLALAACDTAPKNPPPPPAPVSVSMQELMQQAETSAKEGRREASRLQYREAARTYPTQKAPWSKLAEDYFDAGDYGNAILAAQEVLQRDAQDVLAQSILAVGGLRVSTTALTALRAQQAGVPKSTRDQAADLTQTLRTALGEDVLVPAASPTSPAPPARGGARSQVVRRPASAASAPIAPAAAAAAPVPPPVRAQTAAPKPPPAPAPPSNPFDRLK